MLTAIVLTREISPHLNRTLDSLKFCDQVNIVDEKTKSLDNDFAAKRNWALSKVKSGWVLFVDDDEVVSPKLAIEIQTAIQNPEIKGYYLPRQDFMWGQFLKHGDTHVSLLRLGLVGEGKWQGTVHETWQISGPTAVLKHSLLHYPHPTVVDFLMSINFYSTLRAAELYKLGRKSNAFEIVLYPPAKFMSLYLFKLGLFDGTAGFIHAMLMAFYSFMVRGKLFLLGKGIS